MEGPGLLPVAPSAVPGWMSPSASPLLVQVHCIPISPAAQVGQGQPVGENTRAAGGNAWLRLPWEQGAKAFPVAGAAMPGPSPHPSTRHAWERPCTTMGGCGPGWGGGERAASSGRCSKCSHAEASEGQGPCVGLGAAWPEAGAALGCCCPKPLHPTASKPHGPWWPRGGCRGCWRGQRWGVSSWHPWQTLFSPEMPKGRRRPVLSLRL